MGQRNSGQSTNCGAPDEQRLPGEPRGEVSTANLTWTSWHSKMNKTGGQAKVPLSP